MNKTQQQLLYIVKQAIHNGEPTFDPEAFSSINSKELYDLAWRQNVCALVFPEIEHFSKIIKLDEEIMHKWRLASLFIITHQIRRIRELKTIFELFKSHNIQVISLKGLALRQLYPQPELRNMGDIDLLILENHMQKSIDLLNTLGYQANLINMNDPYYMHIDMHKKDSFPIELHRTLWHPKHMKKIDNRDWFNHIWKNYRFLNVEGIEFNALSYEDELINLVVHLARDLKNNGANLQQLCDIVLLINKNHQLMDFDYIDSRIKGMNLFTYYQYLLITCDMFLGLRISLNYYGLDRSKSVNLMINILDSSGYYPKINDNRFLRMKIFLNQLTLTRKLLKPLRTRARFLRSIGLRFRY